jgi:hypothetical protein
VQLHERLTSPAPKRILALDGGGARIMMALGFLEEIERILRERYEQPDLRLCDYFDLIGGTSAGAFVAATLATGLEIREVIDYSLDFADKIFQDKKWKFWEARYDESTLAGILIDQFGDLELGDPSIRSGLCIITKRADTRSTWPLMNHPDGKFYDMNKHLLLRKVVQASTAAPIYFVPVGVDVGTGEPAAFVDGGVSMANNPALQMFMMATLSGYPFHWQTGAEQLLITSVGTGFWQAHTSVDDILDSNRLDWAMDVPMMLMDDASMQNQLLLQWLSQSPTAWNIDLEVGDLSDELLVPEPLMHYLRYNVRLNADELCDMDLPEFGARVSDFYELSCAEHRHDMLKIGRAAALRQIRPDHFPKAFDPA